MSYCRWSSLDGQCDVYVYADVSGGWTTHVASLRPVKPWKPMPSYELPWEEFESLYKAHSESVASTPKRRIGLSHNGESFNDATPGECADRLEALRAEGYIVPQYAIDELREEETAPGGGEEVS